jgi:hypothetical protein
MGTEAFVIDDTSALGRRARALLAVAGIGQAHGAELLAAARLLLVDAPHAELERAARAGASRIVHVQQAVPLLGDRAGQSLSVLASAARSGVLRVRTQLYFENLLPRLALGLATGRFLSAAPTHRAAYVAHEDAAILAAALLASDVREPDTLHVTGPSSFSHEELCALAGELFSRRVLVESVAVDKLASELIRTGMSAEQAALGARGDRVLLHAQLSEPSPDGPRVTGVAALSLPAFLQRARDGLRAVARGKRAPAEFFSRPDNPSCTPVTAA